MNLLDKALFGANDRGIIIFGFEIYYYALMIVTGMLLATFLSALLMKRRNVSPDIVYVLFIACIPSALLCARLYYCVTDGMHVSQWFAWDSIRKGGLSILGGVMGGVLAGGVVCFVKKINFLRVADCVVINILIAQALGRWGNYFNQEVYGGLITDPAQQWFPWAVQINGSWYHALFFYESVINTIGFGLLYAFAWYYHKKPNGIITCLYFVWYGTVRAIMEPMRNPAYILGDGTGVMWSQLTSILLIVAGVVAIGVLLFFNYKKEGALVGSKRGESSAIAQFIPAFKGEEPYFSKINLMGANYPPKPVSEKKRKCSGAEEGEPSEQPSEQEGDRE